MRRTHYKIKCTFFLVLTCYMPSAIALHNVMAATEIVAPLVTALSSIGPSPFVISVAIVIKKYFDKKWIDQWPDASEDVKNYVKAILGDDYTPKTIKTNSCHHISITRNTIVVNYELLSQCKTVHFQLFHEAGHVYNFHRETIMYMLSPFITYFALYMISAVYNKMNISFPKIQASLPMLRSYPFFTRIGCSLFELYSLMACYKFQEQSADEFACKNIKNKEYLETFMTYLKRHAKCSPSILSYFMYPSPESRIAMFQKYINEWDKNHSVQ